MKKRILIVSVLVFLYSSQYAQNIKNEDKIDPAFRSLLTHQKQEKKKKCSSELKSKENKRSAIKNATATKKYECIIYTKNATALKDKGISIHSTLPTFVTAIVSLEQIKQLSLMDEVSYIEASKNNYPNK
ncbi:MAG: hypothetical protein ACR2KZ_09540 [Segetibacter sp.]